MAMDRNTTPMTILIWVCSLMGRKMAWENTLLVIWKIIREILRTT